MIALGCIGGTAWMLDAPGRIWPWFPLGFAACAAVSLAGISAEEHAAAAMQAAISLLVLGGAFAWAGEKFVLLDYAGLRWLCWGAIVLLALNLAARVLLACWPRQRQQVDSGAGKGDDAQ